MRKLRFYTNKIFDEIMTDQFLDVKGGGVDFGKGILTIHPKLKAAIVHPVKRNKIIHDYFDAYYRKHRQEIEREVRDVKRAWAAKEDEYAAITESYFGGFRFPPGKYIAYASIVNCNPRFLDSKTFQFFYKKRIGDTVHTIAHELLHFIFFDFTEKKMRKEMKALSESQLWDLSEIFNVILLRSARYSPVVEGRFACPYPNHQKYISQFEKEYAHSKNAEEFIKRGVRILQK